MIRVLNGNSFDVSGSFISDISGAITINNINEVLRFVIDSNAFNNRDPSDNMVFPMAYRWGYDLCS